MKKINVFNFVSIDGFFAGPNGEIDWFKAVEPDDEWFNYTHKQAGSNSTLIFGHTTYEMMKSFWPTPDAIKMDPGMAQSVNHSPKIVFSKTLKSVKEEPNWTNITFLNEINKEEVCALKAKTDMTILGSGTIVQQFTNLDLIDEYSLVVVPIILGAGKPMFADVKEKSLKLIDVKKFSNGLVVQKYKAG